MSAFINHGGGPDETPEGTHVFVQWKGTDVCLDFWCDCGAQGHFDGYFAYVLRCTKCGQDWEMPSLLVPRKVGAWTYEYDAKLIEGDDDEALGV